MKRPIKSLQTCAYQYRPYCSNTLVCNILLSLANTLIIRFHLFSKTYHVNHDHCDMCHQMITLLASFISVAHLWLQLTFVLPATLTDRHAISRSIIVAIANRAYKDANGFIP